MEKGPHDFQSPLHAAGEGSNNRVASLPEFNEFQEFLSTSSPDRSGDSIDACMQREIFPGGELGIESWVLENDPNMLAYQMGLPNDVIPGHLHRSTSGAGKGTENIDCRRFACSVRTEEGEEFSSLNREANTVDCGEGTKSLG